MLDDAFDSRSLDLFRKLKWYPIDILCLASRLHLFKKIRNKLAPEYLTNKLETFKYNIDIVPIQNLNIIYLFQKQIT